MSAAIRAARVLMLTTLPASHTHYRTRCHYKKALDGCDVLQVLGAFQPRVAGTPPLGLDLPGSDIDILCFAYDQKRFADAPWRGFCNAPTFRIKQWVRPPRPVVASFEAAGWRIEVYGEARPVDRQRGWRHFDVERRLLALGGYGFRRAVIALRRRGLKTEPAFATALGQGGDPYIALLNLYEQDDEVLLSTLRMHGFAPAAAPHPDDLTTKL